MRCAECETVRHHIYDRTLFWISLPTQKAIEKVEAALSAFGCTMAIDDKLCIKTYIDKDDVDSFLKALSSSLNGQELANTNILTAENDTLSSGMLGRVLSADIFIHRYESLWIADALEKNRYETWFQPIYPTNGKGGPFAYEGLFRMRDEQNTIIPPNQVFDIASKSDLLFTLDLAARRSAVECAGKLQMKERVFINFNPSSVYDPSYCLRTTVDAVREVNLDPSDIVFEITETHLARDKNHLKSILDFYRSSGFGVALDDIGSGWSGLNMLHEMRPDYLKVDMDLIRNIDTDSFKQAIVRNLHRMAHDNGIKTIAEGIETQEEASVLREFGADYLQGYLFGRPSPTLVS